MKVDGVLIWQNSLKNFKSPNVASLIYQKDWDIQTTQNVRFHRKKQNPSIYDKYVSNDMNLVFSTVRMFSIVNIFQITMVQFRMIHLNWHQSMVFQYLSVRNGGNQQMEAKVLPIGFMKLTNRLLQSVISRHFLKSTRKYRNEIMFDNFERESIELVLLKPLLYQ